MTDNALFTKNLLLKFNVISSWQQYKLRVKYSLKLAKQMQQCAVLLTDSIRYYVVE
jgi:hypothetical protein